MHGSSIERDPAFVLHWSFDVGGDPAVATLRYRFEAVEEIYVGDKLWDYDPSARRVPDPFGVYRFVHGERLRLLFGQAPWPPNVAPRNVYKPLFTRVLAGATHGGEVRLAVPIDEYSPLARDVASPTDAVQVARVELIVEFRPRSEMRDDPRPPPGESPAAGYIVHDARRVIGAMEIHPVTAKRRRGPIARVRLPGDP